MELSKQHFRTTVPTAEQQKEMGKKYDSFFKNEKKRAHTSTGAWSRAVRCATNCASCCTCVEEL